MRYACRAGLTSSFHPEDHRLSRVTIDPVAGISFDAVEARRARLKILRRAGNTMTGIGSRVARWISP